MNLVDVERVVARALKRFAFGVERVSDLIFSNDGAATGQGAQDQDVGAELAGVFGVASRPLDGGDGIVIKFGARDASSILVGFRHRQYEIPVEKGELGLYNAIKGCTILLDKTGKISVATPAGQDVEVLSGANVILTPSGGGTAQVAGSGHPMFLADVLIADLQAFMTVLNTILQAGTAGSPVKQVIVLAAQLATTQLYTRLQAGGAAYKSTVATNG